MGLLTLPFELPFLPVKGVIKLGEIIRDQAEGELHDPARVRKELEETEREMRAGEISPEEAKRRETAATGSMYARQRTPGSEGS